MSDLQEHFSDRFNGSLDQAKEIHAACKKAMKELQIAENAYAALETTDSHMKNRKSLGLASGDIYHFGVMPIEAKYPELKDDNDA